MGKNNGKEKKDTRRRLNSIILLLAFAAIMLIVSTYAWFSTQKSVKISNLAGTVQVAEGLEISLDGKTWKQEIDLSKVDWSVTDSGQNDYPVYAGNDNNIPEELQPVSTTGVTGQPDVAFYRGTYLNNSSATETLAGVTACAAAETDSTSNVGAITAEVDDADYPGYIAFDVFIKNTIQSGDAKITEDNDANALQLNLGSFVQILDRYAGDDNKIGNIDWANNVLADDLAYWEASNLTAAARVGLAVYNQTMASSVADAHTLGSVDGSTNTVRQVAIWEPNSATHLESVYSAKKTQYATDLADITGGSSWNQQTPMDTWGVTSTAAGHDVPYIYRWFETRPAGTYDTYLAVQNTNKTTVGLADGSFGTDNPETTDVDESTQFTIDDYTVQEGIVNLYDTTASATDTTNRVPFAIKSNAISRVRVYLWLEGQDVDCLNIASTGHGVLVDLDLCTGETPGVPTP